MSPARHAVPHHARHPTPLRTSRQEGPSMTPARPENLAAAVAALRAGGVVAYPTEAVYGLGCDPHNRAAFDDLFALKQRPPTQGVLLIAADFAQVEPYIDLAATPAAALARARRRRGPARTPGSSRVRGRAGVACRRARRHRPARHRAPARGGAVPRVRRRARVDQREPPRRATGAHRRRGACRIRRRRCAYSRGRTRGT